MNNFLNLAGLGALGGIIASSWNTIKTQLDKVKQLVFVSTTIHTRLLNQYSYLFIRDNYKLSFLEKKEYIRDYRDGFCKYIILNNSIVRGKGLEFFWVTIDGNVFTINYIRGFFNLKRFIQQFDEYWQKDMNSSIVYQAKRPSISYIESKERSNTEYKSKFPSNSLSSGKDYDNESNFNISISVIHDNLKDKHKDHIVGKPFPADEFKHNYILPNYLKSTTKEFLDWANPDIHSLFKDILNISSAKGYCLYGLPGTGKSSYIKYLAERANGMHIDIIQLNTISSKELVEYFKSSKDSPVIRVIEDIDSVFNLRTRVDQRLNSSDLTFDILLNCISGVDSPTAGFIFITTNHLDKVDPALLRAGRLDNVIEIRIPDKEDYINMYESRMNMLFEYFTTLQNKHDIRFLNLNIPTQEEISNLQLAIENSKDELVNLAIDNKHTTAQFDLTLKNKIAELYLKYRSPII